MKVLVLVALFAFVAVQVCQSDPVPDDDKTDKADVKKDEPAAPVPLAADVPQAETAAVTEAKSESAISDTVSKLAESPAAPAEEKKE